MGNNNNTQLSKSPLTNLGIGGLIDKYFDGLTSLAEEESLRDYFQEENVAEEFEIYKPMFQFFSLSRTTIEEPQHKHQKIKLIRWLSIVSAACLLLFVGLRFTFNAHKSLPETSTAYIDGKKYTDIILIQTEALEALENLSEGDEDIYSSQIEALEFFLDNK